MTTQINGSNSKADPHVLYSFQNTKLKVKWNMHFQKHPGHIFLWSSFRQNIMEIESDLQGIY